MQSLAAISQPAALILASAWTLRLLTSVGMRAALAVCLASSFTGRMWHPDVRRLGTEVDRNRLESLRAEADLVLYGGQSVRTDLSEIEFRIRHVADGYLRRTGRTVPDLGVVTTSLDFDIESPFWRSSARKIHVFDNGVGTGATDQFPPNTDVHRLGEATMVQLLDHIVALGYRKVLCEGGGRLFGLLAKEGLVDELFLTIAPWQLSGRDTPATMTGEGIDPARLSLVSTQVSGDEVFLRYRYPGAAPWLNDQRPL